MSEQANAAQATPNAANADSGQAAPKVDAAAAQANAAPAEGKKPEEASVNNNANNPNQGNDEVKYELKIPEGSQIGKDAVDGIVAFAKENKLSADAAQKILDRESEAVSSFAKYQQEQYKAKQEAWVNEIKNDKELGGSEEAFVQNMEYAKRVVDRFGTDAFKKTLNETGLGNHPELVRIFNKIGRSMAEDRLVTAGTKNSAGKSMEDIFYGSKQGE